MNYKYNYTIQEIARDFENLKNRDHKLDLSVCGNIIIHQLLGDIFWNTKTKRTKSLTIAEYIEKHQDKLLMWTDKIHNNMPRTLMRPHNYRNTINIHCGSLNLFKANIGCYILERFNVKSVLDPYAGWGTRFLACIVKNINYIGFDTNTKLQRVYNEIAQFTNTQINWELISENSIDYSFKDFEYDTIFSCPPYYNTEIYEEMPNIDCDLNEWVRIYLVSLFAKSKGKKIILVLPENIINLLVQYKIVPNISEKILMPRRKRPTKSSNNEYICYWVN